MNYQAIYNNILVLIFAASLGVLFNHLALAMAFTAALLFLISII